MYIKQNVNSQTSSKVVKKTNGRKVSIIFSLK